MDGHRTPEAALNRVSLTAVLLHCESSSLGWGQETPENSGIRLIFDRGTGLFEAGPTAAGSMRLLAAEPVFEKDGRTMSAGESAPHMARKFGLRHLWQSLSPWRSKRKRSKAVTCGRLVYLHL
jgi:hypothetical protein